jgi:hypothetical protein
MAHDKTIAQSRDRQGADPLADARGSVRAIFETELPFSWPYSLQSRFLLMTGKACTDYIFR